MSARMLEQIQQDMLSALDQGPSSLVFSDFAGSADRILMGMKVHANTVTHARLVALEETFPRLRGQLGHERFNDLSRSYLDGSHARDCPLDGIGQAFPFWLGSMGETEGASVARFEWCWLESYHAPEAQAMQLADLAGLSEDDLLGVIVGLHPATRVQELDPALRHHVEPDMPEIGSAAAILIARPEAEVRVAPLTATEATVVNWLDTPATIRNLFARWTEQEDTEPDAVQGFMPALITLLNCGALVRGT